MATASCVFCDIVEGRLPSTREYEDEEIIAFRSIQPEAPIHVLVVPKVHIAKLSEANQEHQMVLGKIQLVLAQLARDLGIAEAFRVQVNNGAEAGQVIFHLHYHLLGGLNAKKGGK